MADHTRYVDVAVSGGLGDGTSWANAWNSLFDNWVTLMALGGSVDVFCRGGADPWPEPRYFSGATTYLRVIGNWGGFDFNDSGFTIQGTSTTDIALLILNPTAFEIEPRINATQVLRLEKLKMETSPLCVASHASRIIRHQWNDVGIEMDGVGVTLNAASPDTNALYGINQTASTTNTLSLYNCTFRYGQYPTPSSGSRLYFRASSGPATTEVANCVFHANPEVLANDFAIVAGPGGDPVMPVRNCIITGRISGGYMDRCIYHAANNSGPLENSQQVPVVDQQQWWVDSEGGNFTPVDLESGPIELVDYGVDASAYVGSSLDVKGNDRNSPQAGDAWDVGPYEWGFPLGTGIVYTLTPNADGTQRTNYPNGDYAPTLNLPAPTMTIASNITQSSMQVAWSYPTSGTDADGFVLQRWIVGTSTSWTSHPATNPTPAVQARTATETGLPSGTTIRFRIAAKSGDVRGDFSEMFDG